MAGLDRTWQGMAGLEGGVRGLRDAGIGLIFGGINAGWRDWTKNLAGIRD